MGTQVEEVKKPAVIGSSSEGLDSNSEFSGINVDVVLGLATTPAPPADDPNTDAPPEDITRGPPQAVTPSPVNDDAPLPREREDDGDHVRDPIARERDNDDDISESPGEEKARTEHGGEKREGELWRGEMVLSRGVVLAAIILLGFVGMCCMWRRSRTDSVLKKRRDEMKKGRASQEAEMRDLENLYPNITEETKPLTPNTLSRQRALGL